MPASPSYKSEQSITRERLAELLNEDLSREYQAIIAYVVYSQVLKGAEYMSIADQLEAHAHDELKHALIISRQIDYWKDAVSDAKARADIGRPPGDASF
jgi:ferritin